MATWQWGARRQDTSRGGCSGTPTQICWIWITNRSRPRYRQGSPWRLLNYPSRPRYIRLPSCFYLALYSDQGVLGPGRESMHPIKFPPVWMHRVKNGESDYPKIGWLSRKLGNCAALTLNESNYPIFPEPNSLHMDQFGTEGIKLQDFPDLHLRIWISLIKNSHIYWPDDPIYPIKISKMHRLPGSAKNTRPEDALPSIHHSCP